MITKEVVTISPKKAGQTTKLSCATTMANKRFVLTQNWKVVLEDQLGKGEYANEKMMDIPFSTNQRVFRFAFDLFPEREKPEEKNNIDDYKWRNERTLESDKKNAAFNFFAKHMQVEVVGMKNPFLKGEAMFIMNFENHRTVNNCNESDRKVDVYNKVNAMSLQDKLNLALYFMPTLYGKRHSEIKDKLINIQTGFLLQEPYLTQVLEYDPNNVTVAMRTYVNKAIQMGILSSGPNGYYMQGNVFVGQEPSEAIGFFLKDPDSYNNVIVPTVNKMVKLPEDDLVFIDTDLGKRLSTIADYQRNKTQDHAQFVANLSAAQAEGKLLGIKNVEGRTYASLLDEIDKVKRGEHKYIKSKTGKLTPTTDELETLKLEAKKAGLPAWALYKDVAKLRERLAAFKATATVSQDTTL